VDPEALARDIRAMVGLTGPQAQAVDNYAERLQAEGVSAEQIDARLARYREQLLRLRGEMIAHTEIMTSLNSGHHVVWQQAVKDGNLKADEWHKIWMVIADDRMCNICSSIPSNEANQNVSVEGYFVTGNGQQLLHPPAHVNCRCVVSLRRNT